MKGLFMDGIDDWVSYRIDEVNCISDFDCYNWNIFYEVMVIIYDLEGDIKF